MSTKTTIRICEGCFEDPSGALRVELEQLAARYGQQLEIVQEECLDVCENEPVIAVNDIVLAPAVPRSLKEAVEKQF